MPTAPNYYSERNERVVALVVQHCRRHAVEAASDAALKGWLLMSNRSAHRRAWVSAMHIMAVHRTAVLLSRCGEMQRHGSSLRGR